MQQSETDCRYLRDQLKAAPDGVFAPERVFIPLLPPVLTAEMVRKSIETASLYDPRLSGNIKNAEFLLAYVLTRHDAWCRPYRIESSYDLRDLLEEVDPAERQWNGLLPRTANSLNEKLDKSQIAPGDPLYQLFADILTSSAYGYQSFREIAWNLTDLNGPRFLNTEDYFARCYQKACEAEDRVRYATLKPPKEPEDWVEAVLKSRDYQLLGGLEMEFSTDELLAAADMLAEALDERKLIKDYASSGREIWLRLDFPDYLDELVRLHYNPSQNELHRYSFCLKIARLVSSPRDGQMSLEERQMMDILRNNARVEEMIDWIAYGGDLPAPQWLFAINELGKKSVGSKSNGQKAEAHNRGSPLEISFTPGREIYLLKDARLLPDPKDLTDESLAENISRLGMIRLPLTDSRQLEETLKWLYPDSQSDYQMRERVYHAIQLISQYSWQSILRCPTVNEFGHLPDWTRKLVAAGRKAGVYGVVKKMGDKEIVIISGVKKKEVRD